MAKIYTGRRLVTNLAYSTLMKHIELDTSAGAEIGRSVWMVMEVGDQTVQAIGAEGSLDEVSCARRSLLFTLLSHLLAHFEADWGGVVRSNYYIYHLNDFKQDVAYID